jgi:hypothetical protein
MAKQPDSWHQHVINNMLPRMEANITTFEPGPANPQPFSAGMHLQPRFDVIEILPEERKEFLQKLRQRSADAHLLIPPGEDVRQASMRKIGAANALKRLTDHPQDGGFGLKDDGSDRRVIEAQRTLEKDTRDFERVKQLQQERTAAWHLASGALPASEDYLRHGVPGNCKLEAVEVVEPKLAKGEGILDGIERLRRRGRELRADLHRIASAPYPSKHVKARMRAAVEALAMQGPDVSMMVEHDGELIWPLTRLRSEVFGEQRQLAFAEVPDTVALFAWLHRDTLIKRLDAEIDTEADDAAALSHEARQKAEAEVMGDLLAVERDECALVWQAQAQNLPCEHRSDCSPLALLGLRLVTAPRAPPPPTSPEHGYNIVGGGRR